MFGVIGEIKAATKADGWRQFGASRETAAIVADLADGASSSAQTAICA